MLVQSFRSVLNPLVGHNGLQVAPFDYNSNSSHWERKG